MKYVAAFLVAACLSLLAAVPAQAQQAESQYSLLVLTPDGPPSETIRGWFMHDPALSKLAAAHHCVMIKPGEARFAEYYKAADNAHRVFCQKAGRPVVKLTIPAILLTRRTDGAVVTARIDGLLYDAVFFGANMRQDLLASYLPDVARNGEGPNQYVDYQTTDADNSGLFRRRHKPCPGPDCPADVPGGGDAPVEDAPTTPLAATTPAVQTAADSGGDNNIGLILLGGLGVVALIMLITFNRTAVGNATAFMRAS